MYIISKHSDYYDSIGDQFGVDKSIVYKRETVEMQKDVLLDFWEPLNPILKEDWRSGSGKLIFPNPTKFEQQTEWFLINFCGVNYLMLRVTYKKAGEREFSHSTPCDVVHDLYGEEIIGPIKEAEANYKVKSRYNYKGYNPYSSTLQTIDNLLNANFSNLIHVYKVPVFVLSINRTERYSHSDPKGLINPLLKDYSFYRTKTPTQAFQEVQQYISGVLGVDANPVVVTDDKYKILAAGFDTKTSFRKDPGKPRPRKSKTR